MPFVQAKCENCGGLLQVDSSKKAAFCPYCGTPYVVQDAINNYITNIGNLHADVVNVYDDTSAKARLEAAEAFLKLHKYSNAQKAFEEVCRLTPQDYRGWWGQIRAITRDFTDKLESKSALEKINTLYKSVIVFVPTHERSSIEQQFSDYYTPLEEQNTRELISLPQRIKHLEDEQSKILSSINELQHQEYPQPTYIKSSFFGFLILVASIVFVLFVMTVGQTWFLVPAGIVTLLALIWDVIIRPIRNTISASKHAAKMEDIQNKTKISLEKLHAQRNNTQEELNRARQRLNKLSS